MRHKPSIRRVAIFVLAVVVVWQLPKDSAGQGDFMVYGPIGTSCGTFTASIGQNRNALEWWALGFISGIGRERSAQGAPLRPTDTDGIIAGISRYCSEHPLDTLVTGTLSILPELTNKGR